ncbi:MAG: APC family permease [Actinobacteria bacterium]|nr:APC family permease [Actinomycetota bacterium]
MATSKPKQQLSLAGAVAIGLASMLGAGVFFVWSTAWEKVNDQIFFALAIAALVASLNAASVYQLASNVSRAGGVYSYARVYLSKELSFIAGFSFVFGKLLPGIQGWPAAVAAILLMTALNLFGINRTAQMATVLAITTISFIVFSIVTGFAHGLSAQSFSTGMLMPEANLSTLSAASIIFFAFAGYARVATLGDEVKDPKKNIPKAIAISLAAVLIIYLLITIVFIGILQPSNEAVPAAVFESMVNITAPWFPAWLIDLVVVGASLGSILALLAGVSRTAATMAEDNELPQVFAKRNRFGAPWLAEVLIALGAITLIETSQYTQWVIAFSSFSVLLYYAIGHISAFMQPKTERRQPRFLAILGFLLCVLLLTNVPGPALQVSTAILLIALLVRLVIRRVASKGKHN